MRYSLVVPIYNDAELAPDFCKEVETTFRAYLGKDEIADDVEVLFVDDGSQNDSPKKLAALVKEFPFVKTIALSRNFGQHIAISCGYRYARGEYVGMLNVDQEDPPGEAPKILDELKKGEHDIVGGLYDRRDVPFFAGITSYVFHVVLNWLTGYTVPIRASTMRFMNRRFLDAYNRLAERSRYIPGLEMWLGFKYGYVTVRHQRRRAGTSSYNFRRRLRMAIASIISFSDFPLRLTVKFGLVVALLGSLLAVAVVVDRLFFRDLLPGYASTLAVIVLLGGVQIVVTGVASLYVGRILAEVQGRPLFVVREVHGDLPDEPVASRRMS